MKIPGSRHVAELFRWEKRLLARFVLTALGRSAASFSVIILIKEFLSAALADQGSVAGAVAARFGSTATVWILAGCLFVAYVAGGLCGYGNQVTLQRIVKVLELGMMERLIRHLLTLSVPFFDRQSRADLVQAVRTDVSQLRLVVTSAADFILESVVACGLVIAAVSLSPWLALWGLCILPLTVLPMVLIARRTLSRSFTVRKTGYALFDILLQILSGIRVIKTYRGERAEAKIAVEKGRAYFDELIEMVRVRAVSEVVLESVAGLGVVVVIVAGGLEVMHGRLGWPALLAFVMALRALHGPLNNMNRLYVQMQTFGASVKRIDEILHEIPDIRDRPGALPLEASPRTIRFEDVSFSYGEGTGTVLDSISFEVRGGETIGIVGPSGAGKSTLLNLFVRFYDPTHGRVLFDGTDLRDLKIADVYDKVAIVTQEPFIFATSIRENIRYGRPGATDAEVEAAARAAYIHDEVRELPESYETAIGIGGRGLSGGQQQRLNVARALLKNAPILLLDEATSALDSVAEAEVQRAIERLMEGRTSFIIAHRLSTLRHADRILVLDGGRLVGFGPHDDLVETCPVYRRIWETQRVETRKSKAVGAGRSHAVSDPDPVPYPDELLENSSRPTTQEKG